MGKVAIAALVAEAQRLRDRHAATDTWSPANVERLAELLVRPDRDFCFDVANNFQEAPLVAYDGDLVRRYDLVKEESREQYEALLRAGIEVEPWLGPGQPYRVSAELVRRVRETGTIRVFPTRNGHGPPGSTGFHPLRGPSGITAGKVALTHNDVFRAIHDVFGHVLFGHSFGLEGELKAAYSHMLLFSEDARPVLFAEQVSQICWFFLGPHVRDGDGRARRPDDPEYVPPSRRPYPEQKVFHLEPGYLEAFRSLFHVQQEAS